MKDPKFIDVDGIDTRYFEAGRGTPLLLIHGGTFGNYYNAYHWSLNFDALSDHFQVFALDKLGMGYTGNPERDADYTMARTTDHIAGFMRTVGIDGAVLVGHSRGALPAARIAVDLPDLVKALVIVDSNTLAADHPSTPKNFYKILNENPGGRPDEAFVRLEPEANSFSRGHITADFVDALLKIARLEKTQQARTAMLDRVDQQFRADVQIVKYETLDAIRAGRLKAPTLVVWGLNDPSAPVALGYELFQHIALALPQTQLHVFNQAGHYVYREHAAQLNQLIVDFVMGFG